MSWRRETQRRTVGERPCFGASIPRGRGASSGGVGEALLDGPGWCARRRELDGARVNCARSGRGVVLFLLSRGGGGGLVSRLKNARKREVSQPKISHLK